MPCTAACNVATLPFSHLLKESIICSAHESAPCDMPSALSMMARASSLRLLPQPLISELAPKAGHWPAWEGFIADVEGVSGHLAKLSQLAKLRFLQAFAACFRDSASARSHRTQRQPCPISSSGRLPLGRRSGDCQRGLQRPVPSTLRGRLHRKVSRLLQRLRKRKASPPQSAQSPPLPRCCIMWQRAISAINLQWQLLAQEHLLVAFCGWGRAQKRSPFQLARRFAPSSRRSSQCDSCCKRACGACRPKER